MSLALEDLRFGYGRLPVLSGLSAGPLRRGQISALVGPNGSGKSTLFRCIAGSSRLQHGCIRLDGRNLCASCGRERARSVFHLAQDLAARAALSVFQVVLLARKSLAGGFRLRADARDLRTVEAALAELGLHELGERPVATLSGGQRQLVGVAQALVRDADVLLLDEPTSALDMRRQLEVMETIGRVARERDLVAVAAIHDLSLAARFADRLLVLRDGRIAEEGPPDLVLGRQAVADTYAVGIHLERSARGSLLVEPYLPAQRAAE